MDTLSQRITLVRTGAEHLQDYLDTLSPTAWHHPSACAGWEVGDVVLRVAPGEGAASHRQHAMRITCALSHSR